MKDYLDKKLQERRRQFAQQVDKKLGVGVLGLHEGRTLLVGLERTASAYAAAGCDLEESKIAKAKNERPDLFYTSNYDDMLKRTDVNIVAIYTPDAFHGEHIVSAFEAGKDVICTKPIVNSVGDAKKVLKAAKKTGRKLLVGQSTRFFEPFRRMRASFNKGDYGDVELVDAHYNHRMDWFYEKSPWAATDTDWVFLGLSHPVDLIRWYLGPIEEVNAYGYTTELGKKYGLKGFDVYIANLKSKEGKIGRAMGNYGIHELPSARNCIELFLCGSKKTGLAQYHDMKYKYTSDDGTEVCEDPLYELRHYYFNSEIHGMHYGEFANYAEYFAQAILNNQNYSPNLEEGIETFCIMEAVRRSAETGKPVKLESLLREAGLQDES